MTHGKIDNTYEHKPKGAPKQIVLLLHGLGANGRDLLGLAPIFAQSLPEAIFISPDAPFSDDWGTGGFQWFSLQEWTPESILRGVQQAAPILDDFITAQLEKYNLPASKLALVGFSQGTMMSLYTGPRHKNKIAGIVGFSGALVDAPKGHKLPVCLVHGEADTVVPVSAYHHAKAALEQAGFEVTGHTTPGLPHGIDEAGIAAASTFLKNVLNAA